MVAAPGTSQPRSPSPPPQLQLEKHKGEILGVVVVESGWGSILPTVILANMLNGGPAARSGKLSIGDQIMSIDGTSLVGLPLATCQGIIKVRTALAPAASLCTRHGVQRPPQAVPPLKPERPEAVPSPRAPTLPEV